MKKIFALCLSALAVVGLAACGGSDKGSVYFYNFKPEADAAMKAIAKEYTEKFGVEVKVETAASGQYESSLENEIIKDNAPTIFSINGPVGYQNWKEYTMDLSNTKLYKEYLSANGRNLAIKDGNVVAGIPVTVEGYGLVYNKTILNNFLSSSANTTGITSIDGIDNYAKLKLVVEGLDANKATLGIDGVFATCLKSGSQWPYQTHTANIPFYYEFLEANSSSALLGGLSKKTVEFKYENEYKNIIDLYLNYSATEKASLDGVDYDTAVAQFATGKAAILQQGNWVYGNIDKVEGKVVTDKNIGMLPIYTGHAGEENRSICVGTENFWCVNKDASKADREASIAFLEWLFSSTEGKAHVTKDLGFIAPFATFTDADKPTDPLAKEVLRYMDSSKQTIDWAFAAFPSENFKNVLGQGLVDYSKGTKTWPEVVAATKASWATEASGR